MIITLEPDAPQEAVDRIVAMAERYKGVSTRVNNYVGDLHTVTEILLIGDTSKVTIEPFESFPEVKRAVRVQAKYKLIGRHGAKTGEVGFEYNGVKFTDQTVTLMPGLCAVDSAESVEKMMACLQENGLQATRMGAYKPRTSPYDFQGLGKECLEYVFTLADKYGIKVIAMEVLNGQHIEEIRAALKSTGASVGVMLQIGTRNSQNFELLKQVGAASEFPVLFKRGFGITLEESLNAAEYIAYEGNPKIVFCLRGVKSHLGAPHRNLVDFAHVPVVRRLTRLPVCIDPSHSVGSLSKAPDGVADVFHVVAQGIISGATQVLIDFHPTPEKALCDGPQALSLSTLPKLIQFVKTMRAAYEAGVGIIGE
eukprot:GFYU01013526.1.p1 GENE.GFYU01013526.1~~GFYU01013526.1.p1  ORF type:complete len:367 (+),score=122.84 GFYU01013526.1:121-1221(+)